MAVTVGVVDHRTERKVEKREFSCGTCGYGIVVTSEPPVCPMCRSSVWKLNRHELLRLGRGA